MKAFKASYPNPETRFKVGDRVHFWEPADEYGVITEVRLGEIVVRFDSGSTEEVDTSDLQPLIFEVVKKVVKKAGRTALMMVGIALVTALGGCTSPEPHDGRGWTPVANLSAAPVQYEIRYHKSRTRDIVLPADGRSR